MKLDALLAENGRSRQDIGVEPRLSYGEGDPDTWQQNLAEWQATGATHLTLNTLYLGFDTPQKHIQAMQRFAQFVFQN